MNRLSSLSCVVCAGLNAWAGPLDKSTVASDAKWVIHLDLEAFRGTTLGGHVTKNILQPKIDQIDAIKKMNLSVNLQNISGLTAYGPAFQKNGEGVLVLSTSADLKKDLDTMVGMASLSGTEKKDIVMLQQSPYPLYSLKDQLFIAPGAGKTFLLAKSRAQIELAREVVTGEGESLAKTETFSEYPAPGNTFFFLGMAEGFNDNANIPPQAQVLRETKGGRLVIGEKNENVFVNLVFKGKDDESSTKIQQVLQGIVALVSLSQQDKEITELAHSTKIAGEGRNVSVTLQFAVGKAIKHIDSHTDRSKREDEENEETVGKSEPEAK